MFSPVWQRKGKGAAILWLDNETSFPPIDQTGHIDPFSLFVLILTSSGFKRHNKGEMAGQKWFYVDVSQILLRYSFHPQNTQISPFFLTSLN